MPTRSVLVLALAVGAQGRPALDAWPERTLSAPRHHEEAREGGRGESWLDLKKQAVSLASATGASSPGDTAVRKAMEVGELEALMIAIHEYADTASPEVLDEARGLRDTLREAKTRPENLSASGALDAADAALRKAVEAGELEALLDAIHENSDIASPEVLDEARGLRDTLREAKHVAAGTTSARDSEESEETAVGSEGTPEDDICPKPATWCSHTGATNVPKECGGLPGHYCQDIFGKSGFRPCDEKVNATWGKVVCVGNENDLAPAATPAPAAWEVQAGPMNKAAEAVSKAAQDADEAEAAKAAEEFSEEEAKRDSNTSSKKAKTTKLSEFADIDRLSDLFFAAKPTSDFTKAGVTIHCFDDTEVLPAEPWRPCDSGMCSQFGKWWSTSIVNWAQRTTFGDHGIILAPDYNRVLCAYPYDSGTMMSGCLSGHIGTDKFNTEDLDQMMTQSMFWKLGYNEVLIDSKNYTDNLPASIAAFVYNLKGNDSLTYAAKAGITYHRYFAMLRHFNLTKSDVPLLKANFSSWQSQKHEHTPPDTCPGGVDAWSQGKCPPKRIMAGHQDTRSEPVFTDMTAHAREYLKANPCEEREPRQWLEGREFREGANVEIPPEYERLRRMQPSEFEEELARRLRTQSKSESEQEELSRRVRTQSEWPA